MAKVTLTLDIDRTEIPEACNRLREVVREMVYPEYELKVETDSGSVTDVGGGDARDEDGDWDDDWDDETDPALVLPGMVLELNNGLVYQVFSVDVAGRIVLDQLEELDLGEDLH